MPQHRNKRGQRYYSQRISKRAKARRASAAATLKRELQAQPALLEDIKLSLPLSPPAWTLRDIADLQHQSITVEVHPEDLVELNLFPSLDDLQHQSVSVEPNDHPGGTEEDLSSSLDESIVRETTENEPVKVTGRRIVDINFFLSQLIQFSFHGNCGLTYMIVESERSRGLESSINVKCSMCNHKATLRTDDDSAMGINLAVTSGMLAAGVGFSNMEEILAAANIPFMSLHLFQTCQHSNVISDAAASDMAKAAAELEDTEGVPLHTKCDSLSGTIVWSEIDKMSRLTNSYYCPNCPFKSFSSASLEEHLTTLAETKLLSCDLCNYTTVNEECLKCHVRSHEPAIELDPLDISDVDIKMENVEVTTEVNNLVEPTEEILVMETIEENIKIEENLVDETSQSIHMANELHNCDNRLKSHAGNLSDKFYCPLTTCNYRCKTQSDLSDHMLTHGKKPRPSIIRAKPRNDNATMTTGTDNSTEVEMATDLRPSNSAMSGSINCQCYIHTFITKGFNHWSLDEQRQTIAIGRPTPDMPNLIKKIVKYGTTRRFKKRLYDEFNWLCGCTNSNSLFCWPCLLFSPSGTLWSRGGFSDLHNIGNSCTRHSKTVVHIRSYLYLKEFVKNPIDPQLDVQLKMKHNEKVQRNRKILKKLINITCLLAKQELSFRGQDETPNPINRKNFIEIVKFLSEYDPQLTNLLESSSLFSSNNVLNELIDAIKSVILSHIKKEVDSADFIAVCIDETSDCSHKSQLSTIIRYVDPSGQIQERFLGFYDLSAKTSIALSNHVIDVVENLESSSKIICQSYDGATVKSGSLEETHKLVKDRYPQAVFVHCFAHLLNQVLIDSVKFISECKIFFATLSGLASFFSHSSLGTNLLDNVVKKRLPYFAPTRWNFDDRLLNTVYNHRVDIIAVFETILDTAEEWDNDILSKASGFIVFLRSFESVFFLNLFYQLYSQTGYLFVVFQKMPLDIPCCLDEVEKTKKFIQNIRDNCFDDILEKTTLVAPSSARNCPDPITKIKQIFLEIVNVILTNLNSRFADLQHLTFLEILDSDKFVHFREKFPDAAFEILNSTYPKLFDFSKLKVELGVIYGHPSFQNLPPFNIFEKIRNESLEEALPELFKLCKLILTLPTSLAERSFSALKRIKSYQQNTIGENVSALSMLAIEKSFLVQIRAPNKEYNFDEEVVKKFVRKERLDFIYK